MLLNTVMKITCCAANVFALTTIAFDAINNIELETHFVVVYQAAPFIAFMLFYFSFG